MVAVHRSFHAILSNATRSGDLVVALHGIRVLVVLRPQRGHIDGSAWYHLIGACVVNAQMSWERFNAHPQSLDRILIG